MGSPLRLNRLGPDAPLLAYDRYLQFQNRLRARRRECVLFCAHPPSITAGVQARSGSLRSSAERLASLGVSLQTVGRAGDYTAHEPGQCVIYPHLDLRKRQLGVSEYFQGLLECTAAAIERVWGLSTENRKDAPGLYLADKGPKLASIGIMFKSFFTSHGVAINISNDLSTFTHIHPCGYEGQSVASIDSLNLDVAALPDFLTVWWEEFTLRLLARKYI